MKNLVKKIGQKSEIKKSKNGWFYLLVPCDGFSSNILVKTSRSIETCERHFNSLVERFTNKVY
jgi:hypothetical protein